MSAATKYPMWVTVTQGGSGFFALLMWVNDTGEDDLPPFPEPYEKGFGRYAEEKDAEQEAREWAAAEGLEFYPRSVPAPYPQAEIKP